MTRFKNWQRPKFDKNNMTQWQWMCQHHENLVIGKQTDIGAFTYINAKHGVEIGENVQIGSHSAIYSDNTIDKIKGKVVIGNNVKIGSHTVILPGVTIGENTIIGAHSLVKKDVSANSVMAGVPVKPLKK